MSRQWIHWLEDIIEAIQVIWETAISDLPPLLEPLRRVLKLLGIKETKEELWRVFG